jgi:23S rRNA-/tRNA-specific pseudouridylate synthase
VGLRRALAADDCQKLYLCEVWGAPDDAGRGEVDIGRRGRRGRTVRVGGGRQPRPAETSWKVLARGTDSALLEAWLHAGRAHQVRAHLASAGFPIRGDDRYGGVRAHAEPRRPDEDPPGLRLHAAAVHFRHPMTDAPLVITAPSPPWARRLLLDGPPPVD